MTQTPLLAFLLAAACHSPSAKMSSLVLSVTGQRNVAILVYPGVELLDFSGPGEVFSAAMGDGGRAFRVYTVAKEKKPLESQGFVTVMPSYSIDDCPEPDIVVVPGGNIPDQDQELQEWVRQCASTGELVMSVCNGAFLLAEAGLLDGLEVTTHHGSIQALSANYPKTHVFTNRRFVDSGHVMTCAGVSAGIDGALHVVERLLGPDSAKATAHYMEYDWRPAEIAAQLAEKGRTVDEGLSFQIARTAREKGTEAALAMYRAAAERPGEGELNAAAFGLLHSKKSEEAVALFHVMAAAFPASASVQDSLAEACEQTGDLAGARQHSEQALALIKPADGNRGELIKNCAATRLVRTGKGDKSALRWGCAPCGGECDGRLYVEAGPCPMCLMPMTSQTKE